MTRELFCRIACTASICYVMALALLMLGCDSEKSSALCAEGETSVKDSRCRWSNPQDCESVCQPAVNSCERCSETEICLLNAGIGVSPALYCQTKPNLNSPCPKQTAEFFGYRAHEVCEGDATCRHQNDGEPRCQAVLQMGDACVDSEQCLSELVCDRGTCTNLPEEFFCTSSSDCPAGLGCFDNSCQPLSGEGGPCIVDASIGFEDQYFFSGEECESGFMCQPNQSTGECQHDLDCERGWCCLGPGGTTTCLDSTFGQECAPLAGTCQRP